MTALTSWLLTYLLHSTLLLGGAALLCAALKQRRLGLQEAVLRAALVGGLLTASLQLGLGMQPLGGVFTLPEETAAASSAEPGTDPRKGPAAADVEIVFGSPPSVLDQVHGEDEGNVASVRWRVPPPSLWKPALTSLWAALALLALARMGVAAVRLRHLLRAGLPLRSADLAARASALAGKLGLRRPVPVSTAPDLEVPLATGVRRAEVYLPTRALEELEGEQQVALCAHELAHVARCDPAWILAARLVEALVPIQPLSTWARRRLQDLAECLSDDLAVAACGRPLGLARSLVDVASWTVARPAYLPAAVSGALSTRSRLANRVERLMDPLRSLERPSRLVLPVAAAAVLATALVTPVVSGQPAGEPEAATLATAESRDAPETPIAPAAPEPPAAPAAPSAPAAPEAPEVPEAPATPEAPPTPDAPEAPEAPQAPEAPGAPRSDAAEQLDELTRALGERAEANQAALAEIQEEVEALVQKSLPNQEELDRLGQEVEVAARALAEARRGEHEGAGRDETSHKEIEAARRQLDEARQKMREAAGSVRIPEAEMRRVREKAREIAEAARPTPEEREEIRRLAGEIARESRPDMSELHDEMKRLQRELERESLSQAREATREAHHEIREALREVLFEIREAARAARETALEAARATREAAREAREERRREVEREREASRESESERRRTLEEAEESHLEQTLEEPSKPDAPEH
jgi:beta-lactamase regulating signal transducer with metallopeptidase domain